MYEIFESLCAERGITPYKFCKDTGVRTSTISSWKKKQSLVGPKLAKIVCDYFDISLTYLMTGVKEELNTQNEKDELIMANAELLLESGIGPDTLKILIELAQNLDQNLNKK